MYERSLLVLEIDSLDLQRNTLIYWRILIIFRSLKRGLKKLTPQWSLEDYWESASVISQAFNGFCQYCLGNANICIGSCSEDFMEVIFPVLRMMSCWGGWLVACFQSCVNNNVWGEKKKKGIICVSSYECCGVRWGAMVVTWMSELQKVKKTIKKKKVLYTGHDKNSWAFFLVFINFMSCVWAPEADHLRVRPEALQVAMGSSTNSRQCWGDARMNAVSMKLCPQPSGALASVPSNTKPFTGKGKDKEGAPQPPVTLTLPAASPPPCLKYPPRASPLSRGSSGRHPIGRGTSGRCPVGSSFPLPPALLTWGGRVTRFPGTRQEGT